MSEQSPGEKAWEKAKQDIERHDREFEEAQRKKKAEGTK